MVAAATPSHRKARASRDAVWVSNGRLVSHTINEPAIKHTIDQKVAELLGDPEKLHAFLLRGGFITPTGKLPKRYGG
jgi:hypothetical protein